MKILVQKFGGTSVASQEARIAVKDKVQKAVRSGFAPVVVVSAMGRKGEPYATDTLIKVLKETNLSVNVRELDMMMCCGEIINPINSIPSYFSTNMHTIFKLNSPFV